MVELTGSKMVHDGERFQFADRSERAAYVYRVYKDYLNEGVVDVGSYKSDLRKYVKGEYFGLDILESEDVDCVLDLEQDKIPLDDSSYNCVVCTDVLEHVDNFHSVFVELLRISNKYVLISLPNLYNYETLVRILFGKKIKFYGLTSSDADDRHKWFLQHRQTIDFFSKNQEAHSYDIVDIHAHPLRYRGLKGHLILFIVRLLTLMRSPEITTMSTWILLRKNR